MNDSISREAAIDALTDYIHNMDKVLGTGRLTPYDCKDAATSVFEELPSVQTEPKWIPCSERLPKKIGDYLVTTHSGQIARLIYMDTDSSKEYWTRCAVAWMPLPKPWKGEKDG